MSPERILQARQMCAEGKFRRKVTAREPEELKYDRITLDCGHTAYCAAWDEGQDRDCTKCTEEWLRQSTEESLP